jgi:hypothetical protein
MMSGASVFTLEALAVLHTQLKILVAVLTLDGNDTEVATMFSGLADTAGTVEPLLSGIDPGILIEIRNGLAAAGQGRRDDARADLLAAYHRLSTLIHRDQPRRAAAAHELTLRWSLEP